jgi:hypothetical protein
MSNVLQLLCADRVPGCAGNARQTRDRLLPRVW